MLESIAALVLATIALLLSLLAVLRSKKEADQKPARKPVDLPEEVPHVPIKLEEIQEPADTVSDAVVERVDPDRAERARERARDAADRWDSLRETLGD